MVALIRFKEYGSDRNALSQDPCAETDRTEFWVAGLQSSIEEVARGVRALVESDWDETGSRWKKVLRESDGYFSYWANQPICVRIVHAMCGDHPAVCCARSGGLFVGVCKLVQIFRDKKIVINLIDFHIEKFAPST